MGLIGAIRNAEDILGDSVVSVNVAGGNVRVPYALLLTRLNTLITLNQLRQEWQGMTEEEQQERGGGSFDDFLENCMIRSNGTLMHFSDWIINRMK